MKRFKISFLLFVALSFCLTSCYTTRTSLGNYNELPGKPTEFSKGKQLWFIYGIFPAGRTQVNIPKTPDCQVVTKYGFVDIIIKGITVGLVQTETIQIMVKK